MMFVIKILLIFMLGLGGGNYPLKADAITVAHISFIVPNNIAVMKEIFKSVRGYSDYEISNLGRVKSLKCKKQRILKTSVDNKGYLKVRLYLSNKGKTKRIHQLVAITFLNHVPLEQGLIVDHKNNNILDNRVTNLQTITQRENASKDRFRGDYSSKYVGVSWNKLYGKWIARIYINGKEKFIGHFVDELEASKAYKKILEKLGQQGHNRLE